jgi:hypothetical protein
LKICFEVKTKERAWKKIGAPSLAAVHFLSFWSFLVYRGQDDQTTYQFQFQRIFGDCGYSALGTTRKKIVKSLKNEQLGVLQKLISPEIVSWIKSSYSLWSAELREQQTMYHGKCKKAQMPEQQKAFEIEAENELLKYAQQQSPSLIT